MVVERDMQALPADAVVDIHVPAQPVMRWPTSNAGGECQSERVLSRRWCSYRPAGAMDDKDLARNY